MQVIEIIIQLIEILIFVYFAFAAVYVFIFGFAGIFSHRQKEPEKTKTRNIAVLIPGYKEDAVIVDVAMQALDQDYPNQNFDVVIIADSFKHETLLQLKKIPIKLVEVSFEKSTKSKALNKAMQTIGDEYDIACVLDADNIMEKDFLSKVNKAFDNGYSIVQGHRVAKNLNTSFAILDAISEEINNNIFRKGHRVLGLSSALIGSGMAFDYNFFKETMSNVKAIGGFDKELELKLLKDKQKIEYLADALVLDEKVQKSEVFANQRRRWLSAQFVYFRRYVWQGIVHLLFKGNIDFADKVYQMVSPPRVLLLGFTTIIALLYGAIELFNIAWIVDVKVISFCKWLTVITLVYLAYIFSVPRSFYNRKTLQAIITLPKAFFIMGLSILKLKGANKKFIHTQHGTDSNTNNKSNK